MPPYNIEQWEHEHAEIEIRRWLEALGQWAPDVDRARLAHQEAAGAALGELNQAQIDDVLRAEVVGRIGCHAEGTTYVVPVTYVYAEGSIYGHMGAGMKLRMVQANPDVCFEVDQIESLTRWRSVIAWGRFEELQGDEAERALQLLVNRIKPLLAAPTIPQAQHSRVEDTQHDLAARRAVVYRIWLTERTGRFEQH
jgi:nitroimidazol reductase NimA-like FMN-containing flavoprotein (pyridoxamine 5'-phosphate oxidase superfamily)